MQGFHVCADTLILHKATFFVILHVAFHAGKQIELIFLNYIKDHASI